MKQGVENRGGVGGGEKLLKCLARQLSLRVAREPLGKAPDARYQDSIPLLSEVGAQPTMCLEPPLCLEILCALGGERDGRMDPGGFRNPKHNQGGILDPRMGHQCSFHFRERESLFAHFDDSVCTAVQLENRPFPFSWMRSPVTRLWSEESGCTGTHADKWGGHDHALVRRINVDFNTGERFPESRVFRRTGLLLTDRDSPRLGGAQHFDGCLSDGGVDLGGGFGSEGPARREHDAAASRKGCQAAFAISGS